MVLGAILFTQAALVAAACQLPERAPAKAISGGAEPACHQQEEAARANGNLCVAHCLADFQNLDKPALEVPAAANAVVLIVSRVSPIVRLPIRQERPKPAVGPPPRILLHSFLI